MEQKINIAEILKNHSERTELYSPICGECYLDKIDSEYISVMTPTGEAFFFNYDGTYCLLGEMMLFPSKENRDWSTWKAKKECPFKPFDKVLVRDICSGNWCADIFSHLDDDTFNCIGGTWRQCIPYNKETEHLVGTNQDCPDKYKIWDGLF
jgi:hypothetical protein